MKFNTISLASFESILKKTDWAGEHRSVDPNARVNGRTSIAYAANCFVTLPIKDQAAARKIVRKYMPTNWRGWPVVEKAAKQSQKAFQKAVSLGTFSDNRQAENYYGHYFFSHVDGGKHVFRHNKTFKFVESPFTKAEIAKQARKRLFWNTKRSGSSG